MRKIERNKKVKETKLSLKNTRRVKPIRKMRLEDALKIDFNYFPAQKALMEIKKVK